MERLDKWKEKALNFIRDCIFDMNKEWLTNIEIANMLNTQASQISYIKNKKEVWLSLEKIEKILDLLNNK